MNRLSGRLAYTWHATKDERKPKPREPKPNHRVLWGPKQDAVVIMEYASGDLAKMAQKIGKPVSAIHARAVFFGMKKRTR